MNTAPIRDGDYLIYVFAASGNVRPYHATVYLAPEGGLSRFVGRTGYTKTAASAERSARRIVATHRRVLASEDAVR